MFLDLGWQNPDIFIMFNVVITIQVNLGSVWVQPKISYLISDIAVLCFDTTHYKTAIQIKGPKHIYFSIHPDQQIGEPMATDG